jgi:apolipoprotein N-acyltransferase
LIWPFRLLALFSGAALALSFPLLPPSADWLTGYPWLAWVALVPLGLVALRRPPRQAFRLGWLSGTLAYLAILSWAVHTMQTYGRLSLPISIVLLILLAGYVGLYVGLFAMGWSWFAAAWPRWGWVAAPMIWVTLEWLRGHLLSGFPWALLGYSQYRQQALIQVADLAGVYGVSGLVVLVNVGFAHLADRLTRQGAAGPDAPRAALYEPILAATLLVTLAVGYGSWRIADVTAALVRGPRVGLIQGNIPQDIKWDAAERQSTLDRYAALTRQAAEQGAEMIVWPESSAPFIFEMETEFQHYIRELASSTRRYLLFGSPAVARREASVKLLNSAYLLNPDGSTRARYDKLHLVPFGEYVPLGPLLGFVNKLVAGIGDFVPGSGPVIMEAAGHPFGVAICFEIIFPELVRLFPQFGAQAIATITNDAWFGRTGAPMQHFSMAVFRAVEHHVPVVRSANTGISGFISATGAIGRTSDLYVEAVLVDTLAMSPARTVYTRAGDIFAVGCGILVAILAFFIRRRT